MATVSTPATLSSVKSVFGGLNNLLSYVRGGSYVQNLPGAYPSIGTSAPLTLSSFAGRMKPTTDIDTVLSVTDYSFGGTAYAAVSFLANGVYQEGATDRSWLLQGSSADYDIYLAKTAGTTPAGSSVNTWLNLATTRSWSLTKSTAGTITCTGTLYVRMTQSPQTTLNTSSFFLSAEKQNDPCPTCCFTPDTLISMGDGTTRAIVAVMVGDWIMVRGGTKQVTEVITRTNRVMYQIQFADGRILNASEDHPLYVVDKGYAAINPGVGGDYKDLGIPDQLYVGDLVLDSDGRENQIVDIIDLDYPETVYTFAESEFYANGMLVY